MKLLERADNAVAQIVTGIDAGGLPTAGFVIRIEHTVRGDGKLVRLSSVAFFYLTAPAVFVCTDAGTELAQRWTIEGEAVDEHLRRALRDSKREGADTVAPGKSSKDDDKEFPS